jgi:hypothetical protein
VGLRFDMYGLQQAPLRVVVEARDLEGKWRIGSALMIEYEF